MADLTRRLQWTAWGGGVKRLADFPRALHVAGGDLQITAGEIDADAVAPNAIQRLGSWDVAAAAVERDDKFDLVVHVLGERRIR